MTLAWLMDAHSEALRADLQRYYGIDIDRAMAGEHSAEHVAACAAYLPTDAMVRVESNPDAQWTLSDTLMAATLNSLNRYVHWRAGGKGPEPRLVGPSSMVPKRTLPARSMSADELMRELAKPRR